MIILRVLSPNVLTVLALLLTVIAAALLLVLILMALCLLGLRAPFLLGPFMERGGEFFKRANEMGTEITFGFMGLLNRLCDTLYGRCEVLKGVMDPL